MQRIIIYLDIFLKMWGKFKGNQGLLLEGNSPSSVLLIWFDCNLYN